MAVSPIDVQKALKGADYPTSRESLIELAQESGASEELIDELEERLAEEEYESPAEVMADLREGAGEEAEEAE